MIFYTILQLFTPSKLQDEMRREDFLYRCKVTVTKGHSNNTHLKMGVLNPLRIKMGHFNSSRVGYR
jgi:hypothetical protein